MNDKTDEANYFYQSIIGHIFSIFDIRSRTGVDNFVLRLCGPIEEEMYESYTRGENPKAFIFHLPSLVEKLKSYMKENSNFLYNLTELDEKGERVLVVELDENKSNGHLILRER